MLQPNGLNFVDRDLKPGALGPLPSSFWSTTETLALGGLICSPQLGIPAQSYLLVPPNSEEAFCFGW